MPVSWLRAVTVTPGSTPPDGSVTVPSMAPPAACDCAETGEAHVRKARTRPAAAGNEHSFVVIDSSPAGPPTRRDVRETCGSRAWGRVYRRLALPRSGCQRRGCDGGVRFRGRRSLTHLPRHRD